jgi:hypothetical protein
VQLRVFTDFVNKADELALSIDDWLEMFLGDFAGEITPEQTHSLRRTDEESAELVNLTQRSKIFGRRRGPSFA